MSLQDTLNEMKAKAEAGMPPELLATMHKATSDLASSGIMGKVARSGDPMPDFVLPDENGNEVSSRQLLEKGPLVVSFYRGVW